jgi:ribosomal protein S18 acetylase RimI-like enzyme
MTFEQISRNNLQINGGNLHFTYEEMLQILNKHNAEYETLWIEHENEIIGYIIYEFVKNSIDTIHISQICVKKECHRQGFGKSLFKTLKNRFPRHTITCDIYAHNTQSFNFFRSQGFCFEYNPEKHRYKGIFIPD